MLREEKLKTRRINTCVVPAIAVEQKSPITSLFKYDFWSKKSEFDDVDSIGTEKNWLQNLQDAVADGYITHNRSACYYLKMPII